MSPATTKEKGKKKKSLSVDGSDSRYSAYSVKASTEAVRMMPGTFCAIAEAK